MSWLARRRVRELQTKGCGADAHDFGKSDMMNVGISFRNKKALKASLQIMLKRVLSLGAIAALGCSLAQAAQAQAAPSQGAASTAPRAVVNRYCVTCHNQKAKTAGLMLDKADIEN